MAGCPSWVARLPSLSLQFRHSAQLARLIRGAKEIYYPGAPHGLTATHQDQVNADLLAFLRS
jgi:pimeloyl-ACP methyl ester carboxylesterase